MESEDQDAPPPDSDAAGGDDAAEATEAAAPAPLVAAAVSPPGQASSSSRHRQGRVEKSWLEKLELLRKYKIDNGDTKVHSKLPLGQWCNMQRFRRKSGKLSEEKIRLLDEVDFHWGRLRGPSSKSARSGDAGGDGDGCGEGGGGEGQSLAQSEINWREQYRTLRRQMDENGGSLRGMSKSNIGGWVKRQQTKHKRGCLSDEKVRMLKELGVKMDGSGSDQQQGRYEGGEAPAAAEEDGDTTTEWRTMYEKLRKYKLRNGDCLVPASYHGDPALGRWVAEQRVSIRNKLEGRSSNLTYGMFADLDLLGFRFVL